MPNILFVDDDLRILTALDNALVWHRREWGMQFVANAEDALAFVEQSAPDVIVTDMRMPGMDGAQLLRAVHSKHPQMVRIVLSAHAEFEATLRAVPIAHHYLLKPCEAGELWGVVERAMRLRSAMRDPAIAGLAQRLSDLPAAPRMHTELTRVLADPSKGIEDCLRLIERDVALTSRVIRLASTAALGFHGRVTSLQSAGVFLGTNMLRNLVLSVEAFAALTGRHGSQSVEREQRHAILTGAIAKALAPNRHMGENACLAGILHDAGALLIASQLPADDVRARIVARQASVPIHVAEQRVFGSSHSTLGAWLLSTWGLPYAIVEAVAYHHDPRSVPQAQLGELGLVHVAGALATELEGTSGDPLDMEYLEGIGVHAELDSWRAQARDVAATIGCG